MSDKKALLVIDMQNDYLWEKRKSMFTYDTETLTHNVNAAIDSYQKNGYDIIYIRHVLSKLMWGVGFSIEGTEGAELYDGLNLVSNMVFDKSRSDAYTAKPFRAHMKEQGYNEVAICGLDECGCVGATAKGAAGTGVKVKVLTNCIGSRFPEKKVRKMRGQLKVLGVESGELVL